MTCRGLGESDRFPPDFSLCSKDIEIMCSTTVHRFKSVVVAFSIVLLGMTTWPARALADHGFDPNFYPEYVIDAFSSEGGNAARQGGKLIRLPTGEVVVAGRVRMSNDAPPYWNIGLVRYGRNGARKVWPGSPGGAYFWAEGQYVVYPNLANGGAGDDRIESIDDIGYADGKIYVLATRVFSQAPFDRDVVVYAFDESGTFRQSFIAIGSAIDEVGRSLDVKATGQIATPVAITILAERNFQRMVVAKVHENQAGDLQADAGFNAGVPLQVSVTLSCAGSPQCNVIPTDLARPQRLFAGDGMPIYVVGAVQRMGGDWDYLAVKLEDDGTLASDFGVGGFRYVPFNQPGSGGGDYAMAVHVESSFGPFSADTLWLAGNVQQSCQTGIGVAKLAGDGDDDPSFGTSGRAVYGGSVETGSICVQDPAHFASDITLQGDEIAIAGDTAVLDQGGQTLVDGSLLRIHADTGSQRGLAGLPMTFGGGGRAGASRLRGIVGDGGSRYTVSGVGDVMLLYPSLFISARTRHSDTVFADEFDQFVEQSLNRAEDE
jgi:hypothetical protein